MPQDLEDKLAGLEALLFVHGEPMSFKKIGEALEVKVGEVKELLRELASSLEAKNRGLTLLQDADKVQFVTKSKFNSVLANFVKNELSEDLTPASLETLAIIAYFGPISRNRIEYQRGVNCSIILRSLMLRGLIERFTDPEHPQSYLYRPTFEFWKHLGLTKPEDMPEHARFREVLTQFETQT